MLLSKNKCDKIELTQKIGKLKLSPQNIGKFKLSPRKLVNLLKMVIKINGQSRKSVNLLKMVIKINYTIIGNMMS